MSPKKMRFAAACLTAAVVCCAISCVLSEETGDNATGRVDQKVDVNPNVKPPNALVDFSLFRNEFHKSYGSALETARRMKLFLARSMAVFNSVVQYSQKKIGSFKAINEFSDRSEEELRKMFIPLDKLKTEQPKAVESLDMGWMSKLGLKKKKENKNDASGSGANYGAPPDDNSDRQEVTHGPETRVVHDLRATGCFNEAQNQGDCGACYAFSMTIMYEYYYCLQHGERAKFSEQYIIDCGYITGSGGCGGSPAGPTLQFINTFGVELASHRPYVDREQSCPYADSYNPQRFDEDAAGFYRVIGRTLDQEVAERRYRSVLQLGRPIYTYFRLGAEEFVSYGGGILCPSHRRDQVGHGVLIIGYGIEDDVHYYIVTNSMGSRWGENGYWRVRKDCVEASRVVGIAFFGNDSNFQFQANRNYAPMGRFI